MWISLALAAPVLARLPGGAPLELAVADGRFATVDPIDLDGAYVVPGLVDSHVHLAYWPVADRLLDAGIVATVDLAAPEPDPHGVSSGPMLTAPGGYPTTSWGRDGYGREVRTPAEARAAVDALNKAGARVLKVPLDHGPTLDDPTLAAAVERAHHHGMKAVAHAMEDASARRAADAGFDVLAHTPTGPLADATVTAWARPDRAVISTLTAFGASPSAVDNLRRLHAAHARILYGTDLGNRRVAGIDADELVLLQSIGMSPAEILAACTTLPAEVWGLDVGTLAPGAPAHVLVLDADPLGDPLQLARPRAVWVHGTPRR